MCEIEISSSQQEISVWQIDFCCSVTIFNRERLCVTIKSLTKFYLYFFFLLHGFNIDLDRVGVAGNDHKIVIEHITNRTSSTLQRIRRSRALGF